MRSNGEIRAASGEVLRGRWFWRLLVVLFVLRGIGQLAGSVLAKYHEHLGVISWYEFLQRKVDAIAQGIDYSLPTHAAYRQMFVATGFEWFVALVLGAVALFGITAVALRAMKGEESEWFRSGFGGFSRPLGITALLFLQNLIVVFWTFFFVIPGLVAAYRYRFAWYLKCENPDWGALKCLRESAKEMKGLKWRAFVFDCHYYSGLFLACLVVVACAVAGLRTLGNAVVQGVLGVVMLLGMGLAIRTIVLFIAARTAFYREAKRDLTRDDR